MVLVRKGQGPEILLMEPSFFRFHRYLFVLSHARSHSTLLCHVLGSHARISGYAETSICYKTAVDLILLNTMASEHGNYRQDCEFVLDKLLYDHRTISDQVLRNPRVTPIFMVREPEAAITSLARMRVREYEQGIHEWEEGNDRRSAAETAAAYYASRLQTLQSLCERIEAAGGRGIFLPAGCLLDDTATTLRFLEHALGLSEPLREEYEMFERTGTPGYGDTSPTIRSGRIVRDRPDSDDAPIPIPAEMLDRARHAYEGCLQRLQASPVLARPGRAVA